jgi:NAD(P)-dependent dehydrogenase (short-subunit alcohol dehydrogenase family)
MGATAALRIADEGGKVVVGDVNMPAAWALADQIAARGREALAVHCDVTDEESVAAMVAATVDRFGGLNAMHVNVTDRSRNEEDFDALATDLEVYDRMMQVAPRGHLLCTRAAVPEMLKNGGGAIVFTSSDAAHSASLTKFSYYVAKAGVNALMRHMALRWGPEGIRTNAICPGLILTDAVRGRFSEHQLADFLSSTPSSRLGEVEDIAALVAFLLSDEAGWINGQAVSINGGGFMKS